MEATSPALEITPYKTVQTHNIYPVNNNPGKVSGNMQVTQTKNDT